MARGEPTVLFIVSRDEPALYATLQREFSGERHVSVILDRRIGERRRNQGDAPVAPERRRGDRRCRPHVDLGVRSIGWAIVHPNRG